MLHVGARSLRTALLATALTTAFAVPASAAPSEQTTSTISPERARTVGDFDFFYRRRVGGRRNSTEAVGRILWTGFEVRNRGALFNQGFGRGFVSFLLLGPDGPVRRTFETRELVFTNFRVPGRFRRIRIQTCKSFQGNTVCDEKAFGGFPFGRQTAKKEAVKKRMAQKPGAQKPGAQKPGARKPALRKQPVQKQAVGNQAVQKRVAGRQPALRGVGDPKMAVGGKGLARPSGSTPTIHPGIHKVSPKSVATR